MAATPSSSSSTSSLPMPELADAGYYQAEAENGSQLGVSPTISEDRPSDSDISATVELEKCLRGYDLFESAEEMNKRVHVLTRINELVRTWVRNVAQTKGSVEEELLSRIGGKVYTFGSYRLGVHGRGADIDTLCVAPRHVDRNDFFGDKEGTFEHILRKEPAVEDINPVKDAFVPVIKLKFDGIEMDMLFARMAAREIHPDFDLSDDMLLKNLTKECIRSVNGCRVTDEILRLVPRKETFRLTLRAIKLWAKKHGIYSNALGYLGGVSWAMLVARTCQLYPNASPARLVHKFFFVFSKWEWPNPVLLKNSEAMPNLPALFDLVWDPRTKVSDRFHLMPIITPAFPQQNSTFNVSNSTLAIMRSEFDRGLKVTEEILSEGGAGGSWERLFQASPFFSAYKHFLILQCSSQSKDDQMSWSGLMESKIRILVQTIEKNPGIKLVHINPKAFAPAKPDPEKPFETLFFMGLELNKGENAVKKIDLTYDIQNFTDNVTRTAVQSSSFREGMMIEAKHVKKSMLAQFVEEAALPASLLSPAKALKAPSSTKRPVPQESASASAEAKDVVGQAPDGNGNTQTNGGAPAVGAESSGEVTEGTDAKVHKLDPDLSASANTTALGAVN